MTLLDHLRKNADTPHWASQYPGVQRGEYAIDGNAIKFAQGGVAYGRKDLLDSSLAAIAGRDIVLVGSPEYVGCGSDYVVVYWDGRYSLVSPGSAEFSQARQLVNEWSGGKAK